jgi:hypothetical protein
MATGNIELETATLQLAAIRLRIKTREVFFVDDLHRALPRTVRDVFAVPGEGNGTSLGDSYGIISSRKNRASSPGSLLHSSPCSDACTSGPRDRDLRSVTARMITRHLCLAPAPRDDLAALELFLRAYHDLYLAVRDGRRPS